MEHGSAIEIFAFMSHHKFQRHLLRLLRLFSPADLHEEIEGDLAERFSRDVKQHGKSRARWRFLWSVIRFFRPGILRRNKITMAVFSGPLLWNNFQMALRVIRRDKVSTVVSLTGLTVSLAAFLLISRYASFELSYDRFRPNAFQTYRLFTTSIQEGEVQSQTALTPSYAAPMLAEKLSGIAGTARLISTRWWFDCTLAYSLGTDVRIFNESALYYADPGVFTVLGYQLLEGDSRTALMNPYSMVLSRGIAQKYFGLLDPVGKTLRLKGSGEDHDYIVTGVMDDPPANSHLSPTILASMITLESQDGFRTMDAYTYVQLSGNTDLQRIITDLDKLVSEVSPAANGIRVELNLEPIVGIHLDSRLQDDMKVSGDRMEIYFLLLAGIVVLVMAWINYGNFALARSLVRGKEVGIRKVSGASRSQIVLQFVTETLVINLVAITGAASLIYFFASHFYRLLGTPFIAQHDWLKLDTPSILFVITILILGIFCSGFFPAYSLSSLSPHKVLGGKIRNGRGRSSTRKITLVFQFACTIFLMVTVVVSNRQFHFMRSRELQVDITQTLVVKAPVNIDSSYRRKLASFKNTLQRLSVISTITSSVSVPGTAIGWRGTIKNHADEVGMDFAINVIDPDFISSYKLRLLAGRDFQLKDFPLEKFGDKLEPVMVNVLGLRHLGYAEPDDIIGKNILWNDERCVVIGVIDNFHQESFKSSIPPMLFTANMGPTLSLKLVGKPRDGSLAQIRSAWNTHFPNNAFDYSFLEDDFDHQYAEDEHVAHLYNLFCILSVVISCLGLFALSLFSLQQRTREIGIRKVLGAPLSDLLRLLTSEYLVLILIASIIALPAAYWGTTEWLHDFAFHIDPGPSLYLTPVIVLLLMALTTVAIQVIKTVLRNPTEILKHE